MQYDLQRASVLKRIAAFLFDTMMIMIAFSLAAALLAWVSGYNRYSAEYDEIRASYEAAYGIDIDITAEEYEKLPEDVKASYAAADAAIKKDERAVLVYGMMFNLSIVITVVGLLAAFVLLEFILPLILKNGQTIGKKMFGIGVMQYNGVALSGTVLFVRAILVKFTVETMIPVLILLMVMLGSAGAIAVMLAFSLPIIQIALLATTQNHLVLHDVIASTVTVDLASQMIFPSAEALAEYKAKIAEAQAQETKTF
jgi:uncharacterized RDD family membrane protein YckC